MSKLSISKDYFTTPMLSPDRNYFLYLNSNEPKRDLSHGYADEIKIYNIEEQKEKSTYREEGTPLKLVGWIKDNQDIKVQKISPEDIKEQHEVSAVNYYLPWDSGKAYVVSRHGTPSPSGSHSPTGSRTSIFDGIGQHGYPAIDFATPTNADDNLRAAAAGTVASAGYCPGSCAYGNLVTILHDDGRRTYYAHMKSISVTTGQVVSKGTILGKEGTTGGSSGDHLHFEWRNSANNSIMGTFTDVGQPRQGYKYTAGSSTPPPPPPPSGDTTPPTTSISTPNSATDNFTATFTDADNVGVVNRYYQVLESVSAEWRGNKNKGFFNDNFGNLSIHSDYTKGLDDWEGTWWETSEGRLRQSSLSSNTAMSTELSQTQGNAYLYHFAAKVNNTSGARRFGVHIMASSQTQSSLLYTSPSPRDTQKWP
jgi:murein DD-endopeptidase MepM/ murein hydrolase activator NlpD